MARLSIFALFAGELGVEQQADPADHAIHGGTDLMAHVRQEGALGTIGSLGLLQQTVIFFFDAGACRSCAQRP